MTLRQKDQKRKEFLEQQIKSVNLDMSILNGISKQNKVVNSLSIQKTANLSLNELVQVLKNKNDKYANLKIQKQQAKEWLKEKGVNLRKLNEEVEENARVSAELGIFLEQKKIQTRALDVSSIKRGVIDKIPQVQAGEGFSADLQSQFINKQKNVTMNRGIISSMRKFKPRNIFRNTLLGKIKESLGNGEALNKSFQQNKIVISASKEEQELADEARRNQYFDFVESLNKQAGIQSFLKLKDIKSFWRIILKQIETIEHYKGKLVHPKHAELENSPIDETQLRLNATLMYKSLRIIEHEFSKSLPNTTHSFEKLDEIIRDMERRNRKLKVWRNSNGEPSWARAFILLRAGRKDEVKRVLEHVDREILEDILRHEQTLATYPEPSFRRHDPSKYKDNFYNQLLYIIEAKQKFDPEIVENESLTKLWILLRTIGLYRENPEMQVNFKKLGDLILKSQAQSHSSLSQSKAEDFIYLGFYQELILMVEMILQNQIDKELGDFNYDDYFHLLTVIHFFPELWGNTSPRQKAGLEAKFIRALKEYMTKLRNEGFNRETTKYVLLCPPKKIKDLLCQFITNRKQYKMFDWQSFKYLLKQRNPEQAASIYMDLSKSVLDSLQLTTFQDFLFAANLYKSTFSSMRGSFELEQKSYVKLLLKHLYFVEKKKYLVMKNHLNQDFTDQMFKFFEITPQEASSEQKLQKKDEEVKGDVKQCQKLLENNIDWDFHSDEYVQNILRPFLFYKKFNELANMLQNPLEKFSNLKNFDHSQMYKELNSKQKLSQHTQFLLQFFRQEFKNEITALYVYYLNALIERKRTLSTKECDYSGLPSYIVNILQGLEKLDQTYQSKAEEFDKTEGRFMTEEKREKQAEKYRNNLKLCDEYDSFKNELQRYLAEYGGTYGLEYREKSQESLSNERRNQNVRRQNFGTGIVF